MDDVAQLREEAMFYIFIVTLQFLHKQHSQLQVSFVIARCILNHGWQREWFERSFCKVRGAYREDIGTRWRTNGTLMQQSKGTTRFRRRPPYNTARSSALAPLTPDHRQRPLRRERRTVPRREVGRH